MQRRARGTERHLALCCTGYVPKQALPHADHYIIIQTDSGSSVNSFKTTAMCCAGKSLVFTAWPHKAHNFPNMPQRLGIVHCLNRPCSLWAVSIPFTCKNNTPSDTNPQARCLTDDILSGMSPKFSPDGTKLMFLSHDAAASSGVHCATAALKSLAWSSGEDLVFYRRPA